MSIVPLGHAVSARPSLVITAMGTACMARSSWVVPSRSQPTPGSIPAMGQQPDPNALTWHNEHCFRGWSNHTPTLVAIVKFYPSLWRLSFTREVRDGDQYDAYCIAARR
jgi:hypothetical protein